MPLVVSLLFGCEGSGPDGTSLVPSGNPARSRDAAAADASSRTVERILADRRGSRVGGHADSGAAPETDAGAPTEAALSGAAMLVEITDDKRDKCRLRSVSPGATEGTVLFDCARRNHVFRRSDGRHFFVVSGKVYSIAADGSALLKPTECDVADGVDFDAEDRMYYRCIGGTTGDLYRDDQLVSTNVVAEFGGVFDNGLIFYHGFEEYRVLDRDGIELTKYMTPPGWTALEDATTISGDTAHMLWVDDADSATPVYVVMKYDDSGFKEVRRITPVEPPPGNFGRGHRLDPSGALYVALEGKVRRYDPDGSSEIVWTESADFSVSAGDELVYYPGVK